MPYLYAVALEMDILYIQLKGITTGNTMRETFEQFIARVNASAFVPTTIRSGNMAKVVKLGKNKEFEFRSGRGDGGDMAHKYPWKDWFNGELLLLERSGMRTTGENDPTTGKALLEVIPGEQRDYEARTEEMIPKIKTAARRRYKVVQISRYDADGKRLKDALIIKARDMNDDEHDAEDLKRAEEKEARKAKDAAGNAASNGAAPQHTGTAPPTTAVA